MKIINTLSHAVNIFDEHGKDTYVQPNPLYPCTEPKAGQFLPKMEKVSSKAVGYNRIEVMDMHECLDIFPKQENTMYLVDYNFYMKVKRKDFLYWNAGLQIDYAVMRNGR